MFSHEKLVVYGKALDFASRAAVWLATWDKRHAVTDQLDRASQSILLNLAEAANRRGSSNRLQILDYATGSTLECAACLDVAKIKGMLTAAQCDEEKVRLCEIAKMLVGLRKAWAESIVREDPAQYSAESAKPPIPLFHHERLEVYQAALAFMAWFAAQPEAGDLSNRLLRQLDEAGTSAVLNIAEGNGRYAELDHRRFAQIAQSATVKAAVHLDVSLKRGILATEQMAAGKEKLHRVTALLSGF